MEASLFQFVAVPDLCDALAVEVEGIFRLSGEFGKVDAILKQFDDGG